MFFQQAADITRKVSLSARRAWIEICLKSLLSAIALVALRKESVDRNTPRTVTPSRIFVVALRKESVDRNRADRRGRQGVRASLSARRAWIEIPGGVCRSLGPGRRSPQGERG